MATNIYGLTDGIKASVIRELETYTDTCFGPGEFMPADLAAALAEFTGKTGREIAVLIDRKNYVRVISVGDSVHVETPSGEEETKGLCGYRLIHTHPNGTVTASWQDLDTLRRRKLDAMCVIGVTETGEVRGTSAYVPDPDHSEGYRAACIGVKPDSARYEGLLEQIKETDRKLRGSADTGATGKTLETAILVGVIRERANLSGPDESALDELEELAKTAGAISAARFTQRRDRPDARYYVGSGIVDKLAAAVREKQAELVIFDDELSPSQIRNLEDALNVRVIDRTALILDIFAARAKSVEGKLQVELAQQKYRLPRLTGKGIALSRLGGGIGTRGPGETKLETDRRHINRKIHMLEAKLKEISTRRELLRKERKRKNLPVIAVVGYTNAGKSTLVNALCGSDVFAADELFATLDTSVRKLKTGDDQDFLLVDTVGFIRKLPHELVESFKATLEETVSADLLLHVADVSDPEVDGCIDAVENILNEIGAGPRPRYLVLNKSDKAAPDAEVYISDRVKRTYGRIFRVSATAGTGLPELADAVRRYFTGVQRVFRVLIPYSEGGMIAKVRELGHVTGEEYTEEGVVLSGTVPPENWPRIAKYAVSGH